MSRHKTTKQSILTTIGYLSLISLISGIAESTDNEDEE